jgi:hypothetical protein
MFVRDSTNALSFAFQSIRIDADWLARHQKYIDLYHPLHLYFPTGGTTYIHTPDNEQFASEAIAYLRNHRQERLVITGISTEQCCETTTRLAADLGYDVDFVTEATMTFPISDPETGEELSTDEIIRRTEFVLRRRFARIATVDGLVTELQGAAVPCNG